MRYSARDALNHQIIRKNYHKNLGIRKNFRDVLVNLQNYECKMKIQEAVIDLMIKQFSTDQEKKLMLQPFKRLD